MQPLKCILKQQVKKALACSVSQTLILSSKLCLEGSYYKNMESVHVDKP